MKKLNPLLVGNILLRGRGTPHDLSNTRTTRDVFVHQFQKYPVSYDIRVN